MKFPNLTRRAFLNLAGAATLAPRGAREADSVASARAPNIVLFVPDEMRADSLACYGAPTRTPNFDRLAAEGVRFENCHVQFPVCGASRCSFLTGWPASVHGHRSLYYFLRPDEPNLFRYLKHAGYDVLWFGKNDALAQQTFSDSVSNWTAGPPMDLRSIQPVRAKENPAALSFLYTAAGDRKHFTDYSLVQAAIDAIQRPPSEQPFCIFLPLFEPHPPYTAPSDFYDLYDPAGLRELIPPGLAQKPNFHAAIRRVYGLDKLTDATFRKIRAVYFGQVSYSDWLLGLLLDALSRTGRAEDTAVFAFSDHGDYAGDYGLVEKWPSGLEDALTHVPLIVRTPGCAKGRVASEMVELYDVMQTCLDLAGVKAQHTHFARTLMPQMAGGPGDSDRAAFAEGGYNRYEPQAFEEMSAAQGPYRGKVQLQNEQPETITRAAMVRTRDHKLVVRPDGQSELYSYKSDPREERNLYGQRRTAEIQQALQQRLLDWYIRTTGVPPFDKDLRGLPPR
jgi:arylsulfatase A-like enzyme